MVALGVLAGCLSGCGKPSEGSDGGTAAHATGTGGAESHADAHAETHASDDGHGHEGDETTRDGAAPSGGLGPIERPALSFTLRASDQRRLASMGRAVRDGVFPSSIRGNVENARLFLKLAMDEEMSPTTHAAALHGMAATWSASASSTTKVVPDTDYVAVVRFHLRSEKTRTLARALEAAARALPVEPVEQALVADLVALGGRPDPSVRFAVLDTLAYAPRFLSDEAVAARYVDAVTAVEPFVAAKALLHFGTTAAGLADVNGLWTQLAAAAGALDPGVRGRAVRLMGGLVSRTGTRRGDAAGRCIAALDDPHPFVRSSAASCLGNMQQVEAIPALVAHLGDGAADSYDLAGWTRLNGSPGLLHHGGSLRGRVDDALLDGIAQASLPLGDARFVRGPKGANETLEGMLAREAAQARSWLLKTRPQIDGYVRPKTPKTPPPTATSDAAAPGEQAARPAPESPAESPAASPVAAGSDGTEIPTEASAGAPTNGVTTTGAHGVESDGAAGH